MINIKELQKKINNKSFDIKKLNKIQKIAFDELVNRGLIDLSNIIDPKMVTIINPLYKAHNKLKRTKKKFNKVK